MVGHALQTLGIGVAGIGPHGAVGMYIHKSGHNGAARAVQLFPAVQALPQLTNHIVFHTDVQLLQREILCQNRPVL